MKTLLFVGAAVLAATPALAQPLPAAAAGARDGIQTRAEVTERVRKMFARVDADRDGAITQAEAQAVRIERALRRGNVDQRFARLDSNGDKVISRDEFAAAQERRAQRQASRPGQNPQRMAMRGRMGGAMLRAADLDRDQRVTLQEAERAALQRFDRIDLDRDGRITPAERQQVRQQRQQQRG